MRESLLKVERFCFAAQGDLPDGFEAAVVGGRHDDACHRISQVTLERQGAVKPASAAKADSLLGEFLCGFGRQVLRLVEYEGQFHLPEISPERALGRRAPCTL